MATWQCLAIWLIFPELDEALKTDDAQHLENLESEF